MANEKLRITGKVIDRDTRKGLAGLKVRAWDKKKPRKKPLLETKTKRGGKFEFSVKEADFSEIVSKSPSLYFSFINVDKEIHNTKSENISSKNVANKELLFEVPSTATVSGNKKRAPAKKKVTKRVKKRTGNTTPVTRAADSAANILKTHTPKLTSMDAKLSVLGQLDKKLAKHGTSLGQIKTGITNQTKGLGGKLDSLTTLSSDIKNLAVTIGKDASKLKVLDNLDLKLDALQNLSTLKVIDQHLAGHGTSLGNIVQEIGGQTNDLLNKLNLLELAEKGALKELAKSNNFLQQNQQKLDGVVNKLGQLSKLQSLLEIEKEIARQGGVLGEIFNAFGVQTGKLGEYFNSLVDVESAISNLLDRIRGTGELSNQELANITASLGRLGSIEQVLTQANERENQQLDDVIKAIGSQSDNLDTLGNRLQDYDALSFGDRGKRVSQLHADLQKLTYQINDKEIERTLFGISTRNAILTFQQSIGVDQSGILDERTRKALDRALEEIQDETYRIEGKVRQPNGLPAKQVVVSIYAVNYGDETEKLGEETTTEQGVFGFDYQTSQKRRHIKISVVNRQGKEVASSPVRFNVKKLEYFNVVLQKKIDATDSEYQRLIKSVEDYLPAGKTLASAKEDSQQKDISYLRKMTGWDARLIALAVKASRMAEKTGLSEQAMFGLSRMGVPMGNGHLVQVSSKAIEKALKKANKVGYTSLSDAEIQYDLQRYRAFRADHLFNVKPEGFLSTPNQLVESSSIPDDDKAKFRTAYIDYKEEGGDLWDQAKQHGIATESINRLRMEGKLSFLTLNNHELVGVLEHEHNKLRLADHAYVPDSDGANNVEWLVDAGLHHSKKWKELLLDHAGGDAQSLDKLIPPAYEAETSEERLTLYANDLARKVRLNYPTRIVRHMVSQGELQLSVPTEQLKQSVGRFIDNAEKKTFRFGQTPISAFINDNDSVWQGIPNSIQLRKDVVKEVKRILRLYQITPSDNALQVLNQEGYTSAHEIAGEEREAFVFRVGKLLNSKREAEIIYERSQEVGLTTYNLFTAAVEMDSYPALPAMSTTPTARQESQDAIIKRYPTMESLFGTMDYCSCEHCRSVLSPAAYLVDLLQFLDPAEQSWNTFLSIWRDTHNGDEYEDHYKKPYVALNERRPDLKHIALTCENTNVELPYIDIVNEILEYHVVHDQLDDNARWESDDVTTPDLLAEPRNLLPAAYDNLAAASYPLNLPFNLWLQMIRRFLDHYEAPYWQLLKHFRTTDELFIPEHSQHEYGYSTILSEYLGISYQAYQLFADTSTQLDYESLFGGIPLEDLRSAKTLARALDISYQDLSSLLQTWLVNPVLHSLAALDKLGVDVDTIYRYKQYAGYTPLNSQEIAAFEEKLDQLTQFFANHPTQDSFDARTWLDNTWNANTFHQMLVLADPSAGCSFKETRVQKANGDDATEFDLIKINLFVRLWKTLGWSIEEIDQALRTFLPKSLLPLTSTNLRQGLKTALVYCSHLSQLEQEHPLGDQGRLKWLTLWSDLAVIQGDSQVEPRAGVNPLYSSLFLDEPVVGQANIFDDANGEYLTNLTSDKDPEVIARRTIEALQGRLTLTSEEVLAVFEDAEYDPQTEVLNIHMLSDIIRYKYLAQALDITVKELIAVKRLSGNNPFQPISNDPLTSLDGDSPYSNTIRFVDDINLIKTSGLSIEDLKYLLLHEFDPVGKYRRDPAALLTLIGTVASEVHRISTEHRVPTTGDEVTDTEIREKLLFVLSPDVVETFLGMVNGTKIYQASESNVVPQDQLDPATYEQESDFNVQYDEVRQIQKLSYQGVLLAARKTELENSYASPLLHRLLADVQQQAANFFDDYLVRVEQDVPVTGFIQQSDYPVIYAQIPENLSAEEKLARQNEKRLLISQAFVPYLRDKLTQLAIETLISERLDAEPQVIKKLVTDNRLLSERAHPEIPLYKVFAMAAQRGLSALYYPTNDLSGNPSGAESIVTNVDMAEAPGGTNSAQYSGYIKVEKSGPYRFYVQLEQSGGECDVFLGSDSDAVLRCIADSDHYEASEYVELESGRLYTVKVVLRNLSGGEGALLVRTQGDAKSQLSVHTLFPSQIVTRLESAFIALEKVTLLSVENNLNLKEISHLLINNQDFDNVDLRILPTRQGQNDSATTQLLYKQYLRIASYIDLRNHLVGGDDNLIDVFQSARARHRKPVGENEVKQQILDDLHGQLSDHTRRDTETIATVSSALGFDAIIHDVGDYVIVEAPYYVNEIGLSKLWKVLQYVKKLDVLVENIKGWATQDPTYTIAKDVRDTIRSRYDQVGWRKVARPVFDQLRQLKRDALVAHTIHQLKNLGVDTPSKLFEYFLLDTGMEPVVQTSRIQLAIASVQTFIQRCLMNLEVEVHPSTINAKRWEWMKRYRVWEANRKIYLFPENWLEPEFRDDKTHLFRELESELLEKDVSQDIVEAAYYRYLSQLEQIAHLEIVTTYCEQPLSHPLSSILHVVGRTKNLPYRYFYRKYTNRMWTPWQPIDADIEGDHVVAAVWRERVHVFWLTFVERAVSDTEGKGSYTAIADFPPGNLMTHEVDVSLNWTELFQGQWTGRQAGSINKPITVQVPSYFSPSGVSVHVSKEYDEGREKGIKVHMHFPDAIVPDMLQVNPSSPGQQPNPGSSESLNVNVAYMITPGSVGIVHTVGQLNISFLINNKFSPPKQSSGENPINSAIQFSNREPTQLTHEQSLDVEYPVLLEVETGKETGEDSRNILNKVGSFQILPCSNAIKHEDSTLATLLSPFFYMDDEHTLYVEPTVAVGEIEKTEELIIPEIEVDVLLENDDLFIPQATEHDWIPVDPDDVYDPLDPYINPQVDTQLDWAVRPGTAVELDGELIGQEGKLDVVFVREQGNYIVNTGVTTMHTAGRTIATGEALIIGDSGLSNSVVNRIATETMVV